MTLLSQLPDGSLARFARAANARLMIILVALMLSGCATMSSTNGDGDNQSSDAEEFFDEGDPYEKFNRNVYAFNEKLDAAVIKPVATGYGKLPAPVRNRVSNFFSNLFEPTTIINDVLQGKFGQAMEDSTRFFLNTTVGLVGLFDVAQHVDLPKNSEDFGQTLARWGVPDGPYLVLPLLGPSNVRDAAGKLPYFFATDPIYHLNSQGTRLALRATEVVDIRHQLFRTDRLLKLQLDPYIFVRESYWQRRDSQIEDEDSE